MSSVVETKLVVHPGIHVWALRELVNHMYNDEKTDIPENLGIENCFSYEITFRGETKAVIQTVHVYRTKTQVVMKVGSTVLEEDGVFKQIPTNSLIENEGGSA